MEIWLKWLTDNTTTCYVNFEYILKDYFKHYLKWAISNVSIYRVDLHVNTVDSILQIFNEIGVFLFEKNKTPHTNIFVDIEMWLQ